MNEIKSNLLVIILLTASVVAVYHPVVNFEFLNFDDNAYITLNRHVRSGLNLESTQWAFTSFYGSNWHPLTWLSHMLDVELFGLKAGMHHVTNVVFHLLNSILLYLFLQRFAPNKSISVFVALLFALHPTQVESVAWIAERKNVLSTLFFLLALHAYFKYVQEKQIKLYLLVAALLMLGLMAKPMLVTLPFLLLLLDYWPLNRLNLQFDARQKLDISSFWRESNLGPLIAEKVPLVVVISIAAYLTLITQQVSVWENLPLGTRIANSVVSYYEYLITATVPFELAILYPHPGSGSLEKIAAASSLILCISLACILLARRCPYLLVGWLWFLGTLVPVIGLVQVGVQGMADRYTYIPYIGLFIALTYGCRALVARYSISTLYYSLPIATYIALLAISSHLYLGHWQNSVTIWSRTLAVTDPGYYEYKMGVTNSERFEQVPIGLYKSYHNLGLALAQVGLFKEAAYHVQMAIRINSNLAALHFHYGILMIALKEFEQAMVSLERARQLDPGHSATVFYLDYVKEIIAEKTAVPLVDLQVLHQRAAASLKGRS